ncbi:diaminopimelate epimerase [Sphingobacteriales bacterium UPWRP_1]|nr:diaminopimelate epimerase [Sphingobacteriales bacterium TSM_CSM]PSJ75219.1 diaminopimelate epimerase [Sphingobacteriales bacterium UPWRP_1]
MNTAFAKYHGTGNDFIMIDNRNLLLPRANTNVYASWCHRRFGIGADGVILIQNRPDCDFEMVYYNADGNEGSMCGNGGRCAVAFARQLGVFSGNTCRFVAADGLHEAAVDQQTGIVSLQMQPVKEIQLYHNDYVLNTGSPHYVKMVTDLNNIAVFEQGAQIRYSPYFKEQGINVNFVQPHAQGIAVATYERGVENETYSCGTGVVASAITYAMLQNRLGTVTVPVETKGGQLWVQLTNHHTHFTDIWLKGPATFVFNGTISTTLNLPANF